MADESNLEIVGESYVRFHESIMSKNLNMNIIKPYQLELAYTPSILVGNVPKFSAISPL